MDDYDVFLAYLQSGSSFMDRFGFIFSQHNEHRLAFPRIVAELILHVNGTLDFKYLIYIGNVALFLIFFIVIWVFSTASLDKRLILPIPYFLFSAIAWENITWATGALQNDWVLLYSFAAIIIFTLHGCGFTLIALVLATLASYTSGVGLFVFPVLLLAFLLAAVERIKFPIESKPPGLFLPRDQIWIKLLILFLISGLVFTVYFRNYTRPASQLQVRLTPLSIENALAYFFTFLGSYMRVPHTSYTLGLAGFAAFIYVTWRKYYFQNRNVYLIQVFLLSLAVGATIARSGWGIGQALTSRYTVISTLYLIFTYISLMQITRGSATWSWKTHFLLILLAMVYFSVSMSDLSNLAAKREMLELGLVQWETRRQGLGYPDQDHATRIMTSAIRQGIYQLPPKQN